MKLSILYWFMMIVFSSFAISDSQISPTISPDLFVIFFELCRDSEFGRHPDRIEESAWILKESSGDFSSIRWSATNKKNAHLWRGPVPNGVIALAHTHTIKAYSKPSRDDIAVAISLHIPLYIISEKGIWIVDNGDVKKILGWDWEKSVREIQTKSSAWNIHTRNEFLLKDPTELGINRSFSD